jgi:Flp pilus assembly protein TadD
VVLPDLLSDSLSESELYAVVAHELAHVARRDNLSAAAARVVVSVFWFHPLLWWIERRMLAEREAACDELVLAHGADPADYISAILKVCRMSFAGASGYAGATGANLNHRMEQIMFAHAVRPSSRLLRAIPGAVLVLASILPVSEGFLRGQAPAPAQTTVHSANDVAVQKAYSCWQQGRFQEAEDLFRQIYILDPEDPRGSGGLVESYVSEGRLDDAVQFMQQETAKHPDRTHLRQQLGNLYIRMEQFDQAIAEFQSALDTGKNLSSGTTAELFFRLAEANRLKGSLNESVRLLKASVAANPKDAKALMLVAMILQGTGRDDEAEPVYEQILKLQPDQPMALNNLAYILAQRGVDLGRALAMAQKAAQQVKDPSTGIPPSEFNDTVGWVRLKNNQPDEAAAAFRTALQTQPENPTFHYHLGLALLDLGDRTAAIQEFQNALAHHPPEDVAAPIRELLPKIAPSNP